MAKITSGEVKQDLANVINVLQALTKSGMEVDASLIEALQLALENQHLLAMLTSSLQKAGA